MRSTGVSRTNARTVRPNTSVAYWQIVELLIAKPGVVFFVYFAALTGFLLVLGLLLLLARFPSSVLVFAGAFVFSPLEFHHYFQLLPFISAAATLGCLALSIRLFLAAGMARRLRHDV